MANCYSDDLCMEVFDKFGVVVEDETAKSHPLFAAFLTDICRFVEKDEAKKADLELEQSKQAFDAEKVKYNEFCIVSSALQQVVDNNKGKQFTDQKVLCQCTGNDSMVQLNAASYLRMGFHLPHNAKKLRYLGLTKEFFAEHFHPFEQKFLDSVLIRRVTENILEFCKSVLAFQRQESGDAFSAMLQLPGALLKEKENLKINRRKMQREKLFLKKLISEYFEYLTVSIRLLLEKVELLKRERNFCSVSTNYYSLTCDALYLKARILHLRIKNETYNEQTVLPLKMVLDEVVKGVEQVEQDLLQKTELLESYKSVSTTLQTLAEEFSKLRSQIENEKWTLSVLKSKHGA